MDDLGIFLHVDILTRLDFRLSVDAVAGKHRDILCLRIAQQRLRRRTQIKQAALLSRQLGVPRDRMIVTSSETGQGIDELKSRIAEACL